MDWLTFPQESVALPELQSLLLEPCLYPPTRGDGIAAGLGTFAVSLGAEAALLRSDEGRDEVERWKLMALGPGDGYVAALCGAGVDWRMRNWHWRP